MTDDLKRAIERDRLLSEMKILSKRANSRLDRLVQVGRTQSSAYVSAMRYTSRAGTKSGTHFKLSGAGMNLRQIKAQINEVNAFLKDPTSTETGQKAIRSKVARTLNDRYGLSVSNAEEVKQIFESALYQKLASKNIGSKTIVRIIGSLKRNKGSVSKAMKELEENKVFLGTDPDQLKRSLAGFIGYYKKKGRIDFLFEG